MVGNSRSPSMKNLISPSPNQLLSVCWVQARKVPAYLPRPCTPSRDHIRVLGAGVGLSPLGVEIGRVARDFAQRVGNLVSQQPEFFVALVREGDFRMAPEGHRPKAVQRIGRVDRHHLRIDRGETFVAYGEKVGCRNLHRGGLLAVPVKTKYVVAAQPLHHPDVADRTGAVGIHQRDRFTRLHGDKRSHFPALAETIGGACVRGAAVECRVGGGPCRLGPVRRSGFRA